MVNKHIVILLLFFSSFVVQGQIPVTKGDAPPASIVIETKDNPDYIKREFEEGFQEKYTGDEFVYERQSAGQSQWDRFMEWLARLLREIFTFGEKTNAGSIIVWIIRILASLVILFVVYLIVRAILNKEGMWIFGRQRRQIQAEDSIKENIHEMDFRQLTSETKSAGNYRLALRYYYLWLLKKLSQREIIDWHWDKTNSDYLYEIRDNNLKKDFEYLSYLYDYSWYGEFPIDEAAFGKAEKAFLKTLNML